MNYFDSFERCPIIAAVQDELWQEALKSPAEVIFYLKANIITIAQKIEEAHNNGKAIFIHMDLAEGIGKDFSAVKYISTLKADGIISTKSNLIKYAKETGLCTVQRLFALDSQGVSNMEAIIGSSCPDMIEIMPGIAYKIIEKISKSFNMVIAGGLLENKTEVTEALSHGAIAISTGNKNLWYI